MTKSAVAALVWRQVHWPQPLDAARAASVLRSWAADQRSPRLVLESRASKDGVAYPAPREYAVTSSWRSTPRAYTPPHLTRPGARSTARSSSDSTSTKTATGFM